MYVCWLFPFIATTNRYKGWQQCTCVPAEDDPSLVLPVYQKELHGKERLVHLEQNKKSRVEKGFSRTLAKSFPSFRLHANGCCCSSSNSNSSSSVWKTRVLFVRCYCCDVARSLRDADRLDDLEDCRSAHDEDEQCQQPGSNGVLFLCGLVWFGHIAALGDVPASLLVGHADSLLWSHFCCVWLWRRCF